MRPTRMTLFSLALLAVTAGFRPAPRENALSLVAVSHPSPETMARLAARFEVVKRTPEGYELLVPAGQTDALPAGARLISPDVQQEVSRADRAGYHTLQTVESDLKQIVADHPDLASLERYGFSEEGNPLWVLTLSGAGGGNKPALMFTGATHGNELISTEVVFGEIRALVDGYGKDPRLTSLVDKHVLHFIPVVNADGFARRERYANGVDPNRDYPYPDAPNRNPNAAVRAIMGFVAAHEIKGSVDYHSYGELVMYPWAYTSGAVPDRTAFDSLTGKMSQSTGYRHGQISRILYDAPGSSADYYYWKFGTVGVAVEIGNAFAPPTSQVPGLVQEQLEPAWTFIENF